MCGGGFGHNNVVCISLLDGRAGAAALEGTSFWSYGRKSTGEYFAAALAASGRWEVCGLGGKECGCPTTEGGRVREIRGSRLFTTNPLPSGVKGETLPPPQAPNLSTLELDGFGEVMEVAWHA